MKIGLVDVDNWNSLGGCFPNIVLMKISAFHKSKGDQVEWVREKHYDKVYMSKVFSFSKEPSLDIEADEIVKGGTGYAITLVDGKETYDKSKDVSLNDEIEHIYPDYSLYGITNTAYGFMSRGCPRGCFFCHVAPKEGKCSHKVADLSEFWKGQKNIQLMDPNTLACPDWEDILNQLAESKANVDFNQGVDIRLMTESKLNAFMKVKTKHVHFAFDRYQDKDIIMPRLKLFKDKTGWNRAKVTVYILTNFDTTIEQDLERIMFCKQLNFQPYIMRYDKEHIPRGALINSLARYVNTKQIFWKCDTFDQYLKDRDRGLWV